VLEKALCSGPTLPSSLQDLGEKLMQHWLEINLVTLQKLIETMPHRMSAVIKAKGGPRKYVGGNFFLARHCISVKISNI